MGRLGQWVRVFVAAAAVGPAGCWFAPRPYADDPLLQRGHGTWGDRAKTHRFPPPADQEPAAPPAPLRPAPTRFADNAAPESVISP